MSAVSDAVSLKRRGFFSPVGVCSFSSWVDIVILMEKVNIQVSCQRSRNTKTFSSTAALLPMASAQVCLAAYVVSVLALPEFMALSDVRSASWGLHIP